MSPDPILGDYLLVPGADNNNLPGFGGVFNSINLSLYTYSANNPIKYIDPTGAYILPAGRGFQNYPLYVANKQMGKYKSTSIEKDNKVVSNTFGNYGCLVAAVVNIGNMYTAYPREASEFSGDRYVKSKQTSPYPLKDRNTNVWTGIQEIKNILKDMTVLNFSVTPSKTAGEAKDLIRKYAGDKGNHTHIIANVGGHFINITGYNKDEETKKETLSYHDTYKWKGTPPTYTMDDIKGVYIIKPPKEE